MQIAPIVHEAYSSIIGQLPENEFQLIMQSDWKSLSEFFTKVHAISADEILVKRAAMALAVHEASL